MNDWMLIAAALLAALGLVFALWRLVKGPDAPNRAVALDVSSLISMPLLVGLAIYADRSIYLDVALVYALLGFLAVLSLARYYDRGL